MLVERAGARLHEAAPCRNLPQPPLQPQMMLVDNLIHSDLHPGNILVRLAPPTSGLMGLVFSALDAIKEAPKVGRGGLGGLGPGAWARGDCAWRVLRLHPWTTADAGTPNHLC